LPRVAAARSFAAVVVARDWQGFRHRGLGESLPGRGKSRQPSFAKTS
jgi:hypothetical protein